MFEFCLSSGFIFLADFWNFDQLFQNNGTFCQKQFLAQIITNDWHFGWFNVERNPRILQVLYCNFAYYESQPYLFTISVRTIVASECTQTEHLSQLYFCSRCKIGTIYCSRHIDSISAGVIHTLDTRMQYMAKEKCCHCDWCTRGTENKEGRALYVCVTFLRRTK